MRTNFKYEKENITMIKGDTVSFNVEIFDQNGEPVEVDSAFFTCKKIATGSEIEFQKSLGNGISQTDMLMTVRIAPGDTRELNAGEYFYDFVIGVGDDVFTIKNGILTIEQDVTF